jgi:hypothetical protein
MIVAIVGALAVFAPLFLIVCVHGYALEPLSVIGFMALSLGYSGYILSCEKRRWCRIASKLLYGTSVCVLILGLLLLWSGLCG